MHSFAGNRVVGHTGAPFPIFQAPIGLISRGDLVGAVSGAGGVGLMETMFLPIPDMQAQFDLVRARSNHPFGLHFLVGFLSSQPEREKAVLDWALDGKTKFITTGYGDPARYIRRIKDAGMTTYHMTDTWMRRYGRRTRVSTASCWAAPKRAAATGETTSTPSPCCRRRGRASRSRSWRPAGSPTATGWRRPSRWAQRG